MGFDVRRELIRIPRSTIADNLIKDVLRATVLITKQIIMVTINSVRTYSIVGYVLVNGRYESFSEEVDLQTILISDYENHYAIIDELDSLLDLKVEHRMTTRADRNDKFSSQVITRIK